MGKAGTPRAPSPPMGQIEGGERKINGMTFEETARALELACDRVDRLTEVSMGLPEGSLTLRQVQGVHPTTRPPPGSDDGS